MEGNCKVLGATPKGHHRAGAGGGERFHQAHNRLKEAKLKGFNKNLSRVP